MASLLPRGVSENKDSSARHSLRTAACSAATKRTADSPLTGHDISVFWFSSEMERKNSGQKIASLQTESRDMSCGALLAKEQRSLRKASKFQGVVL